MAKHDRLETKLEGHQLGYLISGLLDREYGVRKAEDSSNVLEIYSKMNYNEKELAGTVYGRIKLKKKGIVCYVDKTCNQKNKIMQIIDWAKTFPKDA